MLPVVWVVVVLALSSLLGCGQADKNGPFVALFSDYGTRDHSAAQLKGNIVSARPDARTGHVLVVKPAQYPASEGADISTSDGLSFTMPGYSGSTGRSNAHATWQQERKEGEQEQ